MDRKMSFISKNRTSETLRNFTSKSQLLFKKKFFRNRQDFNGSFRCLQNFKRTSEIDRNFTGVFQLLFLKKFFRNRRKKVGSFSTSQNKK